MSYAKPFWIHASCQLTSEPCITAKGYRIVFILSSLGGFFPCLSASVTLHLWTHTTGRTLSLRHTLCRMACCNACNKKRTNHTAHMQTDHYRHRLRAAHSQLQLPKHTSRVCGTYTAHYRTHSCSLSHTVQNGLLQRLQYKTHASHCSQANRPLPTSASCNCAALCLRCRRVQIVSSCVQHKVRGYASWLLVRIWYKCHVHTHLAWSHMCR